MNSTLEPRTRDQIMTRIVTETQISFRRVRAALRLLEQGYSVPYIAHYLKAETGALRDVQLRAIHSLYTRLLDLEEMRRATHVELLRALKEERLDPLSYEQLREALDAAQSQRAIRELYAPYEESVTSRAQWALALGLDALVEDLLEVPLAQVGDIASSYITGDEEIRELRSLGLEAITSVSQALEGAYAILAERALTDPQLADSLYQQLRARGVIFASRVHDSAEELPPVSEEESSKFADYFDFSESIADIRPHRVLALARGVNAGVLTCRVDVAPAQPESEYAQARAPYERALAAALRIPAQALNTVEEQQNPESGQRVIAWLAASVRSIWEQKLLPRLQNRIFESLQDNARDEAVQIFSANVRDMLLAPAAGEMVTMGIAPGFKSGAKCAVVSATGRVLESFVIFPLAPHYDRAAAIAMLSGAIARHGVQLLALGSGSAAFAPMQALLQDMLEGLNGQVPAIVPVSEAGAAAYATSALGQEDFPELDPSLRGAVSIARRVQDPLAELVKIDPQMLGVGLYQHDVSAETLRAALAATVQDCVNAVGVDANTASEQLLAQVAGLDEDSARALVDYRSEHGPFVNRGQIAQVPGIEPQAYRQAAGFMRVYSDQPGANPLDATSIHPEHYELAQSLREEVPDLNAERMPSMRRAMIEAQYGPYLLGDILGALQALDAGQQDTVRAPFSPPKLTSTISRFEQLREGMILEGTVTNVASFGAFVDVGISQDGLLHISQMSRSFVANPHDIVRSGQRVRVRVVSVDARRRRVSLSLLLQG